MHHITHYEISKYLTIRQRITIIGCVNSVWNENVWNILRGTMSDDLLDININLLLISPVLII